MGTQDLKRRTLRGHPGMAVLVEQVPIALRMRRELRGLSLRAAADEIGVGYTTISRIESGRDYTVSNLRAVIKWLGGDA